MATPPDVKATMENHDTFPIFDTYLSYSGDMRQLPYDPRLPEFISAFHRSLGQEINFVSVMRQRQGDSSDNADTLLHETAPDDARTIDLAAQGRRTVLWKAVAMAEGLSPPQSDKLFTHAVGEGNSYLLRGTRNSPIHFQRLHIGPRAIPSDLADTVYQRAEDLLSKLNEVLGAPERTLKEDGMDLFLQGLIGEKFDSGQAYGFLRPWWHQADLPVAQ